MLPDYYEECKECGQEIDRGREYCDQCHYFKVNFDDKGLCRYCGDPLNKCSDEEGNCKLQVSIEGKPGNYSK